LANVSSSCRADRGGEIEMQVQVKSNLQQLYYRTPQGLNLSFRRWSGSSTPQLLLLHGFGDNALVWHHFASSLDDSCCPLALDLRGHGHSEWDPRGTYALSDFVADVASVLQELCPAPVVLIGHSLGAQIAIHVAAACRERIRAVVLVDVALKPTELSAGHVRNKFRERLRVYESVADYVALLRQQLPLAQEPLLNVLAEGALRVKENGQYEERCDPMLVNRDDSVNVPVMRAALKQIARPILLVRGAGSAVLSPAAAREVLTELPQSRMNVVATAGHAVMLDNPEGFCAAARPYVLRFSSVPLCEAAAELLPHPDETVRELLEASGQREKP
jgi:pimeloyl-ACP methyl ester carboxylesterase